jgi:hypothetical protein
MNTSSILIHHHLGLGDHIVCGGLVRHKVKTLSSAVSGEELKINLVCKEHNARSVRQMYEDILNLEVILFPSHIADRQAEQTYKFYDKVFRWGFEGCDPRLWQESFYRNAFLDYSIRWSDFYIPRNKSREEKLLNYLQIETPFRFITNSSSTKVTDLPLPDSSLTDVFLEIIPEYTIFDWMAVLEMASEIHCVDSGMYQLIRQMKLQSKKVYYDNTSLDNERLKNWPDEDGSWDIVIL